MNKKYIYVVIILAFLGVVGWFASSTKKSSSSTNDSGLASASPSATIESTASPSASPTGSPKSKTKMEDKLVIQDEVVGTGAEATAGKSVTVNYTGTLTDGTKFDSSYDHGTPFTFNLGAGEVIAGWDQGVAGMKVGGKRKLTIPPSLGYGASGAAGVIPPNATLIFVVELLKVE